MSPSGHSVVSGWDDVDINLRVGFLAQAPTSTVVDQWRSGRVESNQRYYFRRAAEERMAAQRAITDAAREWHAKLAQQFAARALESERTASVA